MKEFIIASNNIHKIKEIKEMLVGFDLSVKSLAEKNIDIDVEEDGVTFEENSKKKATEIVRHLKNKGESDFIVMSDDSGLEVDYLNGAPGVYSARYAGVHGDNDANNQKLLKELTGVDRKKRTARFVCVITAINSELEEIVVRGEVDGVIETKLSGSEGFGYDPLFYVQEYNKTFSEITSKEKNMISHRGRALDKLKAKIKEII
ncbi:XTP/dITP diphosphatase [uncultured Clostridium sp.]|uniref:XTP/dITP diphosphatase n=1 Tax=uncultured Clostridium sp. TaxID=59620 RepID=UPI0026044D5A|nr:XTP/dITP diphosphatase [uncultured Clostridium sp.]